jgi:hypothetical protein
MTKNLQFGGFALAADVALAIKSFWSIPTLQGRLAGRPQIASRYCANFLSAAALLHEFEVVAVRAPLSATLDCRRTFGALIVRDPTRQALSYFS